MVKNLPEGESRVSETQRIRIRRLNMNNMDVAKVAEMEEVEPRVISASIVRAAKKLRRSCGATD